MNIFNICCPCLTSPPEEYAAVDDTTGIGAATVSVGASPDEEMQTNEPSTSGGARGTTPVVTTQPAAVVVPAVTKYPPPITVPLSEVRRPPIHKYAPPITVPLSEVRLPPIKKYPDPILVPAPPKPVAAATVTSPPPEPKIEPKAPEPERVSLIYPFLSEGAGQAQSSQEDTADITQKLKQILASPSFGNQKALKLKNAIRNSGYENAEDKACVHLANVIAATKVSAANADDMDVYIENFLTVCDCKTEDEEDHELFNHRVESLLTAHASIDSAHMEITKFSGQGTFSADTFLMQLSSYSDYHVEYALEEMKECKIDPYTESRLKAVLMFSLTNEIHFRSTHPDKQVTSETVKNIALNKLNGCIDKFMTECEYELTELVIKIVRDLIEGLTLPVGDTEEIFQILQIKMTDDYLSNLLIKK